MSDARTDLAVRKRLLMARSRLDRLKLQHEARELRRSLFTPRTALSFAASAPLRPLVFSALLLVAGRGRLGRVLRGAMAALAVVNAVRAVAGARKER